MLYLPLSFSFFIFLLLHNFIIFLPQFFYSLLHNFTILIFSLLFLLISIVLPPPPPPPHFHCFPSTTNTTFPLFSLHRRRHISIVFPLPPPPPPPPHFYCFSSTTTTTFLLFSVHHHHHHHQRGWEKDKKSTRGTNFVTTESVLHYKQPLRLWETKYWGLRTLNKLISTTG